jgi:hypothetical protein
LRDEEGERWRNYREKGQRNIEGFREQENIYCIAEQEG